MLKSLIVIAIGASVGAWLRWLLGIKLNALFPTIPPGTVVANMVGGYLIGLTIAFLAASPSLSPEWRLLIITGFCGGLTTFSTFSAETVTLIQEGKLLWALGSISLHVVGSLAMTAAGLLSYQVIGTR
ncbi:fluoride efflux transporter CrcB [Pseudomonas sp. FSL R10-0056]|jgi:crcB protein|uniref:fluoride efflux transporter CrcB n=1 Tax=Pseudomonas TaxID=286 RepID=UPI00035725A4|nr:MULTISPECIES: fluoride efflux transporter CrcB [Pseudomonas]EPJ95869.1 camphor resistance protein CrcB [Pseudomonas psychrophila]MDY7584171.1 fluoride efflux transporter CrcB [Pseudomonas sp. CCI3.1]MEB0068965.1 fluoride efflux transporter CrcB [Pseudomonas sp. CCI3.1]MEB0073180.1 fluoride efflux transporter CrcB [Pseudomonas sp. CCI1.4]MQT65033.1 fluoride efflux transporter CrcB [Pseudomonas sp. FSL R10-0056]